jgi:hypothetical protein
MITRVSTLPPGSTLIFAVEVDEFGNETYVGAPMVVGGSTAAGATTVPATYNTPPTPRTTVAADPTPPGGRSLDISLQEGLRFSEATPRSVVVSPNVITGWVASEAVRDSDDVNAYTEAPAGTYCDVLELSSFDMSSIPEDATITGIKVTVERSKI